MALLLSRPKQRLHYNPSLINLFSTSSLSPQHGNESGEQPSQSPSSSSSPSDFNISSYFSGIKSSLKQIPPNQLQDGRRQFARFDTEAQNPAPSLSGNQIGGKFQDVRRNLTEFTRRAAVPPPRDFQDIYKQNVLPKSGTNHGTRKFEGSSFENIKPNLRQIKPQANNESRWSNLSSFKSIMKTELDKSGRSNVIGGAEGLPLSVFGKGIEEEETKEDETEEMKTEFIKNYGTEELGEILRSYRPEGKKQEGWFSLQELNQRLVKLRAMEEEVTQRTRRGDTFMELRSGLQKRRRKPGAYFHVNLLAVEKWDTFSILNGTPKYLLEPPKEQLVETYFHPDNMSSAEKMKIELAKVREEFKMSESDCGSARVQVAQLTTKIKHLSSVLHKKDKHSRKGLIAMVQRRKKLLKYMRRTDWDSYCISLSKLGLRDNPDYKF